MSEYVAIRRTTGWAVWVSLFAWLAAEGGRLLCAESFAPWLCTERPWAARGLGWVFLLCFYREIGRDCAAERRYHGLGIAYAGAPWMLMALPLFPWIPNVLWWLLMAPEVYGLLYRRWYTGRRPSSEP